MKSIIILFFVMGLSIFSYAYNFKKYQVNNGLSDNTIRAIKQDHLGFMWFGAKDGLNRFDGYEFKTHKTIPNDSLSLGNNFVRSIFQDKHHNLWVGTDTHLYILDYYTEKFQKFNHISDLGEIINSGVSSIVSENDSIVWIGTMRQGAFSYNVLTGKLKQYVQNESTNSLKSNVVWTIYLDCLGTIWIGTREGLSRYNRETDSFFTYNKDNTKATLLNDEILSIYEDSDRILWVGTWSGGLASLNKTSQTFENYFNLLKPPYVSHIRSIIEYDKSKIMFGADDGLYMFDKITKESMRIDNPKDYNSLSDQNVYTIYKDFEGGIWIGTYFGGINYMSQNSNIIQHYYPNYSEYSLSGKAISQFCEDKDGNLWIATEDGGLNYFDTKTKKFKVYLPHKGKNSLSYHNIHALLLDDNKLWIGTFSRGIDVLDLKSGKFKNYKYDKDNPFSIHDNLVFSIYKDTHGDIYVGTPFGLCVYNRKEDNFRRIPDISTFVYDIKEDAFGSLWVASYSDGAFRYDYSSGIWKNYRHSPKNSKSVAYDKLTCVYLDGKQRLWFASEGRGICKYNYETDDFTTINEESGIPNNVVYSILDDKDGNLWISSNGGISRIDLPSMDIKTYTQEDGLQGNQFNYRSGYRSKNGIFYFGGINGFNVFDPDKLIKNKYIPLLSITNFEILSDEAPEIIKLKEKINLKYFQSSFRIRFVSLSFQAQEKNKYMYIMEGLNDKWIDLGTQRAISFINLQPGKYRFRVKGSNNDGLWNENGASVEIVISPPIWKSTFAYLFYLLLVSYTSFSVIRKYKKRVRKEQEQRLDKIHTEKEKEIYESKINFFTNIAHEIRTPLSLIKAPLEYIVNSGDGSNETKMNLTVIEKNTDHLLNLINQLLDFRKVEENNYRLNFIRASINQLLTEICYRFSPAIESSNLKINLHLPENELFAIIDKEALIKIVNNLLSNAMKFAEKIINIELKEIVINSIDFFELRVSDDGCGVDESLKEKIFEPFFQVTENRIPNKNAGTGIGLSLTRQLVECHNGIIFIDYEDIKTVFVVRIPRYLDLKYKEDGLGSLEVEESFTVKDNIEKNNKLNILVVDDNEELRAFLSFNLSKDYNVIVASDGILAINIMEETTVDLVISDIMMPQMDGLELTEKIKTNEKISHIPVILLSAKTNLQTKVEGLENGADAYIEKPFSITFLKSQISSMINNRIKIIEKFSKSPLTTYGIIASNKNERIFIDKLNKVIEQNLLDNQFSIEKLSSSMSMSQSNLQRKIKGISGMVPNDYIRLIRLKKAVEFMKSGKYRINEICLMVGFSSPSYFTKCFKKQFGILPNRFIKSYLDVV